MFPLSFNFRVSIDHNIDLKSCFLVQNFLAEINIRSKFGSEAKICQLYIEISLFFHNQASKIAVF